MRKVCPGSGKHAAGHRYRQAKRLVECGRCQRWFQDEELAYYNDSGFVPMGIFPKHQMIQ